jgi:hypothetical protein
LTFISSRTSRETWSGRGKEKAEESTENMDLLFSGLEEICDEELFSEVREHLSVREQKKKR